LGTAATITLGALALIGALVFIGLKVLGNRKALGTAGKHRSKSSFKGYGVATTDESSNHVAPGVRVREATSREGGLNAEDQSGRGVDLRKIDTRTDINVTNAPPPPQGEPGPKA
jgi:hypothetical protein